MKTVIHVNKHICASNKKNGLNDPPLTIKTYKANRKAHTAAILDSDGNVVARVIHSPNNPLPCGAIVWIESTNEVIVE